jgi:dihydroorotate dehydrogenase (fumarate)
MMDLSVQYLGLELQNPLIVGSSGLTSSVKKIQEIEKNGAGAVVLKSIFEEEIAFEYTDVLTIPLSGFPMPGVSKKLAQMPLNSTCFFYLPVLKEPHRKPRGSISRSSKKCLKQWISRFP